MKLSIQGYMAQRAWGGFSTLLLVADAVRSFEESLQLLSIGSVPQEYFHTCLILNLYVNTNSGTTHVNKTKYREVVPASM